MRSDDKRDAEASPLVLLSSSSSRSWIRGFEEPLSAFEYGSKGREVTLCVVVLQYCQICRKGDNEDLLLLCDGCDKGCHTYCHKPKITSIPEGDWYCPACISKVQ